MLRLQTNALKHFLHATSKEGIAQAGVPGNCHIGAGSVDRHKNVSRAFFLRPLRINGRDFEDWRPNSS